MADGSNNRSSSDPGDAPAPFSPQDALRLLIEGQSLTREQAAGVMTAFMDGLATPAQIGGLLIALRMKGESVEEVAGFAQAMRERVIPVCAQCASLVDTCGTGGSAFRVFNVSTAAAFVVAAAGVTVAKHGNRAVTGVCGSVDVLEALGVRVSLSPAQIARCIDEIGIGFLFAPAHHPALKNVGGPRRELGVRTLFNLLGPLSNPAGAARQSMGVYDRRLCALAAGALHALGSERALVVHGEIGLDEISTIGATFVSELQHGSITEYTLQRRDLGLTGPEPAPEDLAPLPTPAENAYLLRDVLGGRKTDRVTLARRDLVAVNAAAALRVAGREQDWPQAVATAQGILDSGEALALLERLAVFTHAL